MNFGKFEATAHFFNKRLNGFQFLNTAGLNHTIQDSLVCFSYFCAEIYK